MKSFSHSDQPDSKSINENTSGENLDEIQDMGELLESFSSMDPVKRGDIVEGVVMSSNSDGILVSFGHKAEGFVPAREMSSVSHLPETRPKVGDDIVTSVLRTESGDRPAILSIDKATGEQSWRQLSKLAESGETIQGTIIGFNRGGAIVDVEGVQGFVPASQLSTISRERFKPVDTETSDEGSVTLELGHSEGLGDKKATPETEEVNDEEIGKKIKLRAIEVNRGRNRAIFSERDSGRAKRDEIKDKLIEELKPGEVVKGKVSGISNFGAFVDLGGADGLVHISELSWSQVDKPEEVVEVGQELDVYVLKADSETKKIALSIKRLSPEPWDNISEQLSLNDVVDATITKLTNFGAFARIEGSAEGLIHVSELTDRMVQHPREVVRQGDKVRVKVLRIEPERRRLGLSLKRAEEGYE
jgi:small subunit ribosomal protein S1